MQSLKLFLRVQHVDVYMDMIVDRGSSAIKVFAKTCEGMNDFSRSLWESDIFTNARTGSDIRYYESGWKLEKYVESEVAADNGLSAAWWLELGQQGEKWVVASNVSVSHSEVYIDLPEYFASNVDELQLALRQSLDGLIGTVAEGSEFIEKVKKLQNY